MVSGILPVCAQKFVVNVPSQVSVGENFRLVYTIDTQNAKDFHIGNIPKALDMITGPYTSRQTSYQMVNGHTTGSSSITFTFILCATKNGVYTIPPAQITANGKRLASKAAKVKVSGDNNDAEGSPRMHEDSGNERLREAGTPINGSDLFIKVSANKQRVHEQEPILLTYKVYTLVDLTQLDGKMPDLTGFHTQEIPLPQQKKFSLEHYKGRNYNTTVWSQYVLFPQQTGKLEIPSITFNGVVAQQTVSDDPFDAFFNGGGYVEVKKNIVTPKLTINVQPLPARPANFSGAVGEFQIASSINSTEVKTNDAVTIKITLNGVGNMKLINTPEVKFPQDFEIYDPKITDEYDLTNNGLSGTKTFEYLAIPRHAGDFTVPAVEFVYFDLKSNSYKTLKTQAYNLKVAKGQGNAEQVISDFTNKENVKILGTDIRFIKMGNTKLRPQGEFFFGSLGYCLWYVIPLLLFVAFVVIYRNQAKENANIAKLKTKKANKVATKRMKQAGKLLAENKKNEFYDEVLKALWGYIGDKLNIPVSLLSKDNVEAELVKYGVSGDLIKEFIAALNECEFARYAPGNESEAMDKVYAASVDIISKMENNIKH